MYTFHTIEERITWRNSDRSKREVADADGNPLGIVQACKARVRGGVGWNVVTAGAGIPVDLDLTHRTREAAADAIVAARAAAPHMLDTVDGLTGIDRALLDFAETYGHLTGSKLNVTTQAAFNLSGFVFWQRVNALVARDEALVYKPVLVARLRRLAVRRRAAR